MKCVLFGHFLLSALLIPALGCAAIQVGVANACITPPIGTPSAGYNDRNGEGMEGTHDLLLAIALFIDTGEKKIVLCSVDHLGFTYEMAQEITHLVHQEPGLEQCEVYIGSSHTHSGGGAYLNIPLIGEILAGAFSSQITQLYTNKTAEAIIQASRKPAPAKIGIGYGQVENLSRYRGLWPTGIIPCPDVAVIKVTTPDNKPLAVLFNFAVHPTVLKGQNRLFSADFVGYARDYLQTRLGPDVQPMYFNGAQGDIIPEILNEDDPFDSCEQIGSSLAEIVGKVWNETETHDTLHVLTERKFYTFKPQPTPFGLTLPLEGYNSEMNILVLNRMHAFITIPGELSTIYDQSLKQIGNQLGYSHVSIFGLTNDAHGYIILPESWRHKTMESRLSFGGENYGEQIVQQAESFLENYAPGK